MSDEMGGILGNILRNLRVGNAQITPKLTQRELVIEFTEKQFEDIAFQNMTEEQRRHIRIVFEQGKMKIVVRLF